MNWAILNLGFGPVKLPLFQRQPTAAEIDRYVDELGVDHPDWLKAFYHESPHRFPSTRHDWLARDCKMTPLDYEELRAAWEAKR